MEYSGIVHFEDKKYCFARKPKEFVFRLETKKDDIENVILHMQDKYVKLAYLDTRAQVPMEKVRSDRYRDYYEAVVNMDVICLRYYFELTDCEGNKAFFGNHEFTEEAPTDIEYMFDCPQSVREEDIFEVPQWAKNKVIYQIFPSRFATDKKIPEDVWYQAPITHNADLKGNLKGITAHLPYIRDLGADIVYLTPIFQSNSSHKYNIDDYYRIDPSFGTKEDLRELVESAHCLGLRVILDGVFNHTSDNFFAFKDIREKQEASKYLDWYSIDGFPLQIGWGVKPNFKTFSYVGFMPKLNLGNPEVQDYVIDVASYWIKECGIDGWRLDVGDEIPHAFWKRFRRELKKIKPELLIAGEIWHFAGDFLEGDEWDTVMNYPFFRSLTNLVGSESITVSDFVDNLGFLEGHLHPEVLPLLWNLMGSHDTPRFLHLCGGNTSKLKLAAALLLLLPGMPMIYYGDEVGMEGAKDPDCRRGMLWDESRQNAEILSYYKRLLQLRHRYGFLTACRPTEVHTQNESGLLARRIICENQEALMIFHCKDGEVSLPELQGRMDRISDTVSDGILKPYQAALFIRE